jgi:hypothetical protein
MRDITMHAYSQRARLWPLALLLAALGACGDEPTMPTLQGARAPNANIVAAPFTVTNLNDTGIGSLRWNLQFTTGGETIRFDSTLAGQTIALDSALKIKNTVTIEGPAAKGITITTGGKGRMITAVDDALVTLRNLTLTGGDVGTHIGGAASSEGSNASFVVENSAVYGNRAASGSAIWGENVTVVNSTVSGNISSTTNLREYPAVLASYVVVSNSTVANNGGAAIGAYKAMSLRNAVVSGNAGNNCEPKFTATITREGANVSDDDTCGGPAEIIIGDPKLGPLANNGGATLTHALLVGSPAINAGSSCSVSVDQRYVPRDALCDLGAFEFTTPTTVTMTIDPTVAVNQSNGWAVVTGTIKCSRNETFSVAVQLEQQQKTGRTSTMVDAAAIVPVECTTGVRPWSALMVLTSGAFNTGSAQAKAQTVYTPGWVSPSSAAALVKMYWARKSLSPARRCADQWHNAAQQLPNE